MINVKMSDFSRFHDQDKLDSEHYYHFGGNLHRLATAIEQERKRSTGLSEPTPVLIWACDAEGSYTFFNEDWLEFTGRSLEMERGEGWFRGVHPEDRQNCLITYWQAFGDRKPFQHEYRLRRFDHQYRWIFNTGVPQWTAKGKFLGYTGSAIDITERRRASEELLHLCYHLQDILDDRTTQLLETNDKLQQQIQERQKAEAALERSQQMLQLVMDNIPKAIFWKDRNSVYLGCNRRGALEAGVISSEAIVGLTDEDLPSTQEMADYLRKCDRTVIETNIPQYRQLETRTRPDGKIVYLETNRIPLHDSNGNIVAILVTSEDITDRKQAEETLLRIRKAVDSTTDAIAIMDATGVQIYQNRAFCDLFEYETVEQFNQHGGHSSLYVDATVAEAVLSHILAGYSWQGEVHKLTRSSRVIPVHMRADAIRDPQGNLVGFICVNTNISERLSTQEKIFQTAQQLTSVIETVGEGITLSNQTGKFWIYNSKMEEITGYTLAEVESSQDFLSLLYPDPQAHQDALTGLYEIWERGGVRDVETTIVTKSGQQKTLLVSTSIVENQDDRLFLSAYRDITERQQALESLQKAEYQYRSLFENAIEGIFQTTWDGHYINVNPALAKIYGYHSPQDMMAQLTDISHQLYVDPGRRPEFIRQLQESDSITNFESQVYRADHQIIWISEKARAVRDSLGQLLYYEGMVEDITERKQAEENLRQQAERQRLMLVITERIRRSLKLDKILDTTVAQVREFLNTDRVVIYRFQDDGNGVMVVESVAPGWKSVVGTIVTQDCWTPHYLAGFTQGQVQAIADISTQDFTRCDIRLLSEFQVQANLVVPILTRRHSDTSAELGFVANVPYNRLWGLLMVQHCSGPREWESTVVDFIKQLAVQLGIAIQQAELYQQLERLATLDGLTQVPNRRHFDTHLTTEWRRCIRECIPISLILCDVDFFKQYNDTYGHQEGDRCLQEVAQALTLSIRRPGDLVARYGGEEFAIILPNTDAEGMCNVADKIRQQILQLQRIHETSPISEYITVSMGGVSVSPNSNIQLEHLIAMADAALYQAKAQGRDRFVLHTMS